MKKLKLIKEGDENFALINVTIRIYVEDNDNPTPSDVFNAIDGMDRTEIGELVLNELKNDSIVYDK